MPCIRLHPASGAWSKAEVRVVTASAPRSGATVLSGSRRSARFSEASGVSLGRDSSRGEKSDAILFE
jgi:hypothetical protein